MTVNILGDAWEISMCAENEDEKLSEMDGYTDWTAHKIVVAKREPDKTSVSDLHKYEMKVLRHEIVHAFLYESGLMENTEDAERGWSNCEEMVDWIAIQGPKIYAAWQEAGAL